MSRKDGARRIAGVVCFVCAVLNLALYSEAASDRDFPVRPIEVVVPAAPGGGNDLLARLLSEVIEPILGQKLIVVNKPGGSGTVGAADIARARPDGYKLGLAYNSSHTMSNVVSSVPYTIDDFTYIALLTSGPHIFAARSDSPFTNAAEFFEYARNNPGKLTYGSDGVGAIGHFSSEKLFKAMNVKLRPIPYAGGGEIVKALLGGHVDTGSLGAPPAFSQIKAGTLKAFFVTTRERSPELPNIPGVSDLGHPTAETSLWRGIVGPKGIPEDRVRILEKAFLEAGKIDKIVSTFRALGDTTVSYTGKQFENVVRSEFAANSILAKELGLVKR